MARLGYEFLNENPVITKGIRRLILGRLEPFARFLVIPRDPHALAAAPGAGLDHHRIADLVRDFHRLVGILDQPHIAGHRRHIRVLSDFLRGDLVPHRLNRAFGRADKGHALGLQRLGEFGVFRQEAIAGMHRLRPALTDRIHDLVDHDIGLVRRRRADMHRLIRHRHVQRVPVRVGIDGNSADTHLARGLDDPAGDFAPVGDQELIEHGTSFVLVF